MNVHLTLALRYLRGRRLRTALTTLSVAIAVMLMFGLNGVFPGVLGSMQDALLASVGEVDLTVTSKSGGLFEPDVTDTVAKVDGVAATAPTIRRTISIPANDEHDLTTAIIVGLDPERAGLVSPYPIDDGRFVADASNAEMMLPLALSERLGLGVGDSIELPSASGATRFTIVGVADVAPIPGSDELFVSLRSAQDLLGVEGRISEVDASLEPNADREAVTSDVSAVLGSAYDVGGVSNESSVAAGLDLARTIMGVFGLFAFAMAGFIIINTFRSIVAERRRDIGMLRAIGASRRDVLLVFLLEGLVHGVVGTFVGLLAGWGLAVASLIPLNAIVTDLVGLAPAVAEFSIETWAISIGLGIGVTVLAALVPARSAARMAPLEALRPILVGAAEERASKRRTWLGIGFLAAAVVGLLIGGVPAVGLSAVLLLVGMTLGAPAALKPVTDRTAKFVSLLFRSEGDVARANLERHTNRAATTVSTVMVSIAIIIAMLGTISSVFAGFLIYIDKSMGADYLVLPQNLMLSAGAVGAGPQLVEDISRTPGIGDVATMRVAQASHGGTSIQAVGIDPVDYPRVTGFDFAGDGSVDDIARLAGSDAIIVNGVMATRMNVGAGDDVTLETPDGSRGFHVVAVGSDYLSAKLPTAYVSQDTLEDVWGVTSDILVMADATEGADGDVAYAALEKTVAAYPSLVLFDAESWYESQATLLGQLEMSLLVLALVLAVPSFLALLNTLAIGVLARTREIGMLRAIGSTRKQVARMIAAEALLLAALGTGAGIIAGIWLGYAMVMAMATLGATITTPYVFPWMGIVMAVVVGLGFGALAAWLPARQATRLDVVTALRYE